MCKLVLKMFKFSKTLLSLFKLGKIQLLFIILDSEYFDTFWGLKKGSPHIFDLMPKKLLLRGVGGF